MRKATLYALVFSVLCYGCAQETNIESSMLRLVPKWDTWTDVTKSLNKYCDEWDSVIVVAGPTIDDELDEILGVHVQEMLQDGERGYYFLHQSSIRRVVVTSERKVLWMSAERNWVSIHRGDTLLVRRVESWGEAIVRRPTKQP